jgi:glycosyltransferase involved in cell wall biosynthesis
MRICIWYKITGKAWGGSNSFLRTLANEFVDRGHKVTFSPTAHDDVVLVNSWSRGQGRYLPINQVKYVMVSGSTFPFWGLLNFGKKPIVQRVDGIARLYGRQDELADSIQLEIARLSSHVVFQSRFSEASFAQNGVLPAHSSIIHNAVDGRIFYPGGPLMLPGGKLKLIAVSWSTNPKKGFSWLPRLAEIAGIEVSFVGKWLETVDPGAVRLLGVKSAPAIAELLRASHALVQPSENETCSNVIVEGLACGLPVLYHPSGGNVELANEYGVPLTENLPSVVEVLSDRYPEFRSRIIEDRSKFLINTCADKYLGVFQEVLEGNL